MPCPSLRPAERRPPEEGSVACLLILHVCDETKSPIEQKHLGTLCEYELILFGTENCWRKRKALPPAMAPQDLQAQRREDLRYAEALKVNPRTRDMSERLHVLFREMHSHTHRYEVDLYRSLQESGGRLTSDGGGMMLKTKFCTGLLRAFQRISNAFEQPLLDEMLLAYGRGPPDTNGFKSAAGPAVGGGGFLEVRWIDFARDVAETYLTHAPNFDGGSPRLLEERQAAENQPVGRRGCTVGQVEAAKRAIRDRLMMKHATVRDALKDVDESGDGVLTRKEVKLFLNEQYLLKFVDFYTRETRGELDENVVETLLDLVDENNDGVIKYDEFSKMIMKGVN